MITISRQYLLCAEQSGQIRLMHNESKSALLTRISDRFNALLF